MSVRFMSRLGALIAIAIASGVISACDPIKSPLKPKAGDAPTSPESPNGPASRAERTP